MGLRYEHMWPGRHFHVTTNRPEVKDGGCTSLDARNLAELNPNNCEWARFYDVDLVMHYYSHKRSARRSWFARSKAGYYTQT